jgi:hypothetical protein
MNPSQSYSSIALNAGSTMVQHYGTYTKVQDIVDSGSEIKKMYDDVHITTAQKVAGCTAEGAFIASRVGELTVVTPELKPLINGFATVTDVGRTVVKGCKDNETPQEIAIKVGLKALSGVGETLTNIARISANNSGVFIFAGTVCTLSSLAITIWRWKSSSSSK